MISSRRIIYTVCTALALASCTPRPHLTTKDVESVSGMTMDQVQAKLGGPYVVTNAGDSVWWDYDDITRPDGKTSGTCQVVFVNGVANKIKC